MAASCWLSAVSAQWLETTIPTGRWPEAICYNSAENKVYCEGQVGKGYAIFVIDGATNLVVAEIDVGEDVLDLCYSPAANKVYCSYWHESYLTVICGVGDTVIANVPAGDGRWRMCCDSAGNRVFCLGDTGTVAVISGAGDSILATLRVGGAGRGICLSPDYHKVFCGWTAEFYPDSLSIIDCATNTICATLPVEEEPAGMCYNPANGYAYCLADYDGTVSVIDGVANQVVVSIYIGYGQSSICCAPTENKIFCTTFDGRIVVVDAAANVVVDSLQTGDFFNKSLYNCLNNKVYCVSYWSDNVTILDGATNQVIRTIPLGSGPQAICHNPVQNRVYVTNFNDSSVSVIRDSVTGIEEAPAAGGLPANRPTIVRGILLLPRNLEPSTPWTLFSITGRRVIDLQPGPNDIRHLAPGVYFIASSPGKSGRTAATKVIVQR